MKRLMSSLPESHYARIVDGRVVQIIPIQGPPVGQRGFPPDFLASLVDVTGNIPAIGDIATPAGGGWTFATPAAPAPDLGAAKSHQMAALRAACAMAIVQGFTSDALGTPHSTLR